MIYINKKIQKIISLVLVILILIPSVFVYNTKQANATLPVWDYAATGFLTSITVSTAAIAGETGADTAISIKSWAKELYQQVLMAIARRVLQEVTKSIVNWINGGFHGAPLFLENSDSFFEDIVKSEVKAAVDMYGYDSIRFPYGKDFAINTINAYKSKLEDNAAYSLSKVMTDPAELYNYQNNFNVGGWNAFLVNTQYPQNNYLGFQMLANEQLAVKISFSPNVNNAITKVKETLQQGQGFLSPEKCMDEGTKYNDTMANAWQRPSFDTAKLQKWYTKEGKKITDKQMSQEDKETAFKLLNEQYKIQVERQKGEWAKDNTCKNLVATTPGSVVADQIKINLGSNVRQKELAAALGNSLSVIFDALIDKFIGDGLNSLASSRNSQPTNDGWSYNGLTLGSPADGNNSSWDAGPDEEIILDKFKKQLHGKTIVTTVKADGSKEVTEEIGNTNTAQITRGIYIPGDIANTETEIILMNLIPEQISSTNTTKPGIIQIAESLDKCVPGPDKAWENRLKEEQKRISRVLQSETNSDDPTKVKASNDIIRELNFAVDSFKDWITTKMIGELPNSILYIDAINRINDFPQQLKQVTDAKRVKSQTLARLKAIAGNENIVPKTGLAAMTTQPEQGSANEKILISFKKQYNSLRESISSDITIENTTSQLDSLKDYLSNIKSLDAECRTTRVASGWDQVGGRDSKQGNTTEVKKFCSIPIVSGYSHGEIVRKDSSNRGQEYTFRNPNDNEFGDEGYQDLPMVNAIHVYGDIVSGGLFGLGSDDERVSIEIDCNTVFKANKTDYTHAGESTF